LHRSANGFRLGQQSRQVRRGLPGFKSRRFGFGSPILQSSYLGSQGALALLSALALLAVFSRLVAQHVEHQKQLLGASTPFGLFTRTFTRTFG